MPQQENPVSHLLWCMLLALRCAHNDTPFTSEPARRKFLSQWLTGARKVPAFSGMAREFTSLRELLVKDKKQPIDGILTALWQQSVLSEQCDFIRLRNAKNALHDSSWRCCLCRFPEQTVSETFTRLRTRHNHYLQLTRTEDTFLSTGQMNAPLTFQLVLNKPSHQFEEVFHLHGFSVKPGAEIRTGKSTLRTVYIGMPSLSENVWGATPDDLWKPRYH